MKQRAEDLRGPRARRLLHAVALRLALRQAAAGGLLALAAAAAVAALPVPAVAARLTAGLLLLAVLAPAALAAAALLRPGPVYCAALAERARPELAGSLILLAERPPAGRTVERAVADLLAERADALLAALKPRQVAALDGASRRLLLGAAVAAALAASGAAARNLLPEAARKAPVATAAVLAGPRSAPPAAAIAPAARLALVRCRYPEYTGLAPRESSSAQIDCLAGARVEMFLETGLPADALLVRLPGGEVAPARTAGRGLVRAEFDVRRTGAYTVLAVAGGGGGPYEAFRGTITARADLPPGGSLAVRELRDGRLALDYRAADDYRLGRALTVFRAGGRTMPFEIPDAAGRRQTQGVALVPREVLAASGDGNFLCRLVALDTRAPEPNRFEGPEVEYRPPRRKPEPGPLLEPGAPPVAPTGAGPSGPADSATRPLEVLYKPDLEPPPAQPSGQLPERLPDDPYVAPTGGEAEQPRPGSGQPPPERAGPTGEGAGGSGGGYEGAGAGTETTEPRFPARTPGPGGGGSAPSAGPAPAGAGSAGPGGTGGGRGTRPPTGAETGAGPLPPERVIPGKVRMDFEPGESRTPEGPLPPSLRTDYGAEAPAGAGGIGAPEAPRAPPGGLEVPGEFPAATGGAPPPGTRSVPPPALQYRRYVEEYLRATGG